MIFMNMFKVILLSWTLSIFTTFQWYYDFVIINFVISSFRVAKNYHLRQAKTGRPGRVEPQGELIHPFYFQN